MAVGYNWHQYQEFAELLIQGKESETLFRVAVSRSYYAAYWQARSMLDDSGGKIPDTGSHQYIWKSFTAVRNSEGHNIGALGFTLRDSRVHADYKPQVFLREDAQLAVMDAADLIDHITKLTDGQKAALVRKADMIFPDYV